MKRHADNLHAGIAGFHGAVIAGLTRNPLKKGDTGIRRYDVPSGRNVETRCAASLPAASLSQGSQRFSQRTQIINNCELREALAPFAVKRTPLRKTSFLPHSKNKTTSVAGNAPRRYQPNYLIKNEVMRSKMLCETSKATVVVLSGKLGGNEVKPLSSKGALNRMANTTIYPYYLYENKEIRGEYEGGAFSTERCNPDGLRVWYLSDAFSTERCNPNVLRHPVRDAISVENECTREPRRLRVKLQ